MFGQGASRVGSGLVAGALIATMATGITFAAITSGGASACVTKKGALALLTKHGKCAKGEHKVSLGAHGPRGLRGARGAAGQPVAPHLYYDMENSSASFPLPASPVAVATVKVPAGTYEVDFVVDLSVTSTTGSPFCYTAAAGHTTQGHDTAVTGSFGQSTGSDIFVTTGASTTISLGCADGTASDHAAYDTEGSEILTALPVGSTN
jgi:hypothetical protein